MATKRARYVIAYDIPSDRRRNRIARTLEGYGERVQYSVFECPLNWKQFAELWKELKKLARPAEDSLRTHRLCPTCAGWVKTVGQAVEVADVPDVYIA